ncbi:MAG: hypothetical protein KDK10_14920 [Maritimibacter sp.]|nr:hypothetical protein [Maritimibacter sp.]
MAERSEVRDRISGAAFGIGGAASRAILARLPLVPASSDEKGPLLNDYLDFGNIAFPLKINSLT